MLLPVFSILWQRLHSFVASFLPLVMLVAVGVVFCNSVVVLAAFGAVVGV